MDIHNNFGPELLLEIKAVSGMDDTFAAMAINYLSVSQNKLALAVNFGEPKLNYKRIIKWSRIE